ncbi:MAG: hypothetical protein U0835_01075 [Isosphaeraceae bacterium]
MDAGTESRDVPTPLPADLGAGDASRWVSHATLGFVVIGLLLRTARYLLNFPLWCDETMIAANFLDRGYLDLFRPLDYRQVGPVLWLAAELTSVKLLGFSELGLRFFPAACGLANVLLFRHVAGRLLSGVPLLLAVAVFAVSGWPLRYVGEVKPYASDLLVALAVLALALEWWRRPDRSGWLWALAAFGPVAVGLSLPSLFVLGGAGLALAWPVWTSRRTSARLALGVYGVAVLVTFAGLLPFYKTAPQDHDYFHNAWAEAFPPLTSPVKLVAWLADVHTGYMFAYPDGGARGASTLTFLAFACGAVVLWRGGRRVPTLLLLLPFALAMLAAALHRYPYGVSARTSQYAAPMICLLTGLGLAKGLSWLPQGLLRGRGVHALAAGLAVVGLLRLGLDLSRPYKTPTDQRVRAFAQWFWTELSRDGELACAHRDLGLTFDPRHWANDATDTYLTYQNIYSQRHRARRPPDLSRVTDRRPLRVVFFNEMPGSTHPQEFSKWLDAMSRDYRLRELKTYPVSSLEKKRGATWDQIYLVYEFVPQPPPVAAQPGAPPRR